MRRPLIALALAAVAALLAACETPIPKYPYDKEPDPRKLEYVIGVGDALEVNVWNNSAVSRGGLNVRPDGTITMPLIGDIQAAGRTPTELKEEIVRRLATFVKDESAVVSVGVTNASSYRFTVTGAVEQAGVFNSSYYLTVLEAVAMAGGTNRYANAEKVVLERRDPKVGKTRRIPINLKAIQSGRAPQSNIYVMPGDLIVVP